MFARYFFIVVGIISLLWIGYVAADIIDKKNAFSPATLFGEEDKSLLIINRKAEVKTDLIPFSTVPKNFEILNALLPHLHDERSIIVSAVRKHFLIESKFNWTKQKVRTLLEKGGLKPESVGIRSFKISGFEIDFQKKFLYFHETGLKTTLINGWDNFDRKSSASLVDFKEGSFSIKDIYFRGDDKIEFHSKNDQKIKGNQINDQELFSEVLPKKFTSYHFKEKLYTEQTDLAFKKSAMNMWMDKGYVSLDIKGEHVIISDFISGQDPINVLSDFLNEELENKDHAFFSGVKLTDDFPSDPSNGFYIYNLNDFVVISESQEICEEIVTQNKLGNTLATDNVALAKLYSELPSRVSERKVSQSEKFSRSIYKTKILETRVSLKQSESSDEIESAEETLTMNVDANILDFISFDGKGNAAVLTVTGELMYYSNGKMTWMKNLGSKPVGTLSYLEEYQFILVTCQNSIHLLDRQGKYILGGVIPLGGRFATQQATPYKWKNNLSLVYPDANGNIISYNTKRKVISVINNSMPDINAPIEAWVSQNKLFYGASSNTTFKMIDAERKKEFRSFALPGKTVSIANSNEIMLFASENSKLIYIDQKGNKNVLPTTISSKLKKTSSGRKETFLINERSNGIKFMDATGYPIGELQFDSQNIEYSDVQTIDGRTYVSVIDGLENNVYLYQIDGRKLVDRSFEGGEKCMLNVKDSKLILTTIVDNYLIQYDLN